MDKLSYLKYFFDTKGYGSKIALQSMIAIQFEDEDSSGAFKKHPDTLFVEGGKFHSFVNGELTVVDGDVEKPFAQMDDRYDFPGDFHPALKGSPITSTFGLMLFNIVLFWEPFKGKVEYVNKRFTEKVILPILSKLMVDNPKDGETVPDDKASVDDCLQLTINSNFLEGLSTHFVKPGGIDALTVDPSIIKRKNELMALHKDELNDPVVFNNIMEELVDMDRKIQLSGPSKNFFIKDKFISTARKRMFIAFGVEPNTDGTGYVGLYNSLDDGIDPNHLAVYINAAVGGSYSRSMATGEGGSRVKEAIRLLGRASVPIEDCETPKGESIHFDSLKLVESWMGGFFFSKKGPVEITSTNAESLVGKTIIMRVPQYCTTTDGNFCRTCLGSKLGSLGHRVSAEVVLIYTGFMLQRMKEHHSSGKVNTTLDLDKAIK